MTDSGDKATSTRTRLVYRLADLTIDVGRAEVRRNDQLIPLPRLSFDLLLALVKAAPDLVTVDQLMEQVWPGVVVNAETVSQRVKLLRVALEDDPKHPRYIAVSRGRGYRILGHVTTPDPAEGIETPEVAPLKLPRWAWGALAAATLAGLAALFFLQRDPPQATNAAVTPAERSVAVLPFDSPGQSPQDAALAFGVAETLLHRLSASKELTVIARQSSFSFAPRGADVRDIGRKLNARFLVEGSLQSTPDRLRITAQLIDATTGAHVWSLQFDRKPQDLFVIQDEIADKVSEAMRISMAGPGAATDLGTQDFDAYLAHAQGRARLATLRVSDAKLAVADFERAIQIDSKFARAYAGLAEARLSVATGEMSRERRQNVAETLQDNQLLLERVLEFNERDADTHLQLADLYWEGDRADRELARAMELNPNSAPAYRLLSSIRIWRDRLPNDAMAAIDQARRLSPLEVVYDNEKATIALWGKSDTQLAEQLSLSVLNRDPNSSAALWRLGELYWCCRSEYARGVKYLEQAMQLDPDYEFGRRLLISAYLDLNDPKEADAVAASAPHPVAARLIPARVYSRDWSAAVELGDESDRLGTAEPIDLMRRIFAMRIHARSTGDYARTRDLFTQWSRVTWDANGRPIVPQTWLSDAPVGLADMLMQMGERERARALLEAVLQSFDDEIRVRGRGEFWYLRQLSLLYALLERDDDALTTLEKCITQNSGTWLPLFMANDPAFQRLRSHPRFRAVAEQAQRIAITQRRELDQMRAKGLVPYRTRG